MTCPYCPRTFTFSTSLQAHIERDHTTIVTPPIDDIFNTPFSLPSFDFGSDSASAMPAPDPTADPAPASDFSGFSGGSSDGGGASSGWDSGSASSASDITSYDSGSSSSDSGSW